MINAQRNPDGTFSAYAWPGGYPTYCLTADGGVLCTACSNRANGSEANESPDADPQWRIVAQDVNWEDPDLHCDYCGTRIESAYAEPEE